MREILEVVRVDVTANLLGLALVKRGIASIKRPLPQMNVGSDPGPAVLAQDCVDVRGKLRLFGECEIAQKSFGGDGDGFASKVGASRHEILQVENARRGEAQARRNGPEDVGDELTLLLDHAREVRFDVENAALAEIHATRREAGGEFEYLS